jgi:hypothetical protein
VRNGVHAPRAQFRDPIVYHRVTINAMHRRAEFTKRSRDDFAELTGPTDPCYDNTAIVKSRRERRLHHVASAKIFVPER